MFVALGGLLLQGMLQGVIAPQRKHLLPPPFKLSGMYGKNMNRNRTMELAFGPLFLASTGFREVVASWLWIRANDMFHSGDYEGLVPLVRTVVLLDPHQIDVYATGAWHMVYNFTDSDQRSDRRYIPEGVAFLKDGIANNPQPYDLYHDMGWMFFDDKIRDYPDATEYFIKARHHGAPPFFQHEIAHSREKEAKIDECIFWWQKFRKETEADYNKNPENPVWTERLAICNGNMSRVIIRRDGLDDLKKNPYDPKLNLDVKITGRYKLLIQGTSRLSTGCRIYVNLQDIDYEQTLNRSFSWRINHVVVLQDSAFVEPNGSFSREIDMSKDPKFYPFAQDKYRLILSFDPRTAPSATSNPNHPPVLDFIGWSGEGLADSPWLYIDKTRPAHVNGKWYPLRMMRKEVIITKAQLQGKEPFNFRKLAGLPETPIVMPPENPPTAIK